jgi:hypothetical protein
MSLCSSYLSLLSSRLSSCKGEYEKSVSIKKGTWWLGARRRWRGADVLHMVEFPWEDVALMVCMLVGSQVGISQTCE